MSTERMRMVESEQTGEYFGCDVLQIEGKFNDFGSQEDSGPVCTRTISGNMTVFMFIGTNKQEKNCLK